MDSQDDLKGWEREKKGKQRGKLGQKQRDRASVRVCVEYPLKIKMHSPIFIFLQAFKRTQDTESAANPFQLTHNLTNFRHVHVYVYPK